jgi:hypothetical protein
LFKLKIENSSFATKLDDYLYNFSKANNCDASSKLYKNKLQHVITWLETKMAEDSCYYDHTDLTFEKDINRAWDDMLDLYIWIENDSFDNSSRVTSTTSDV